MTSPGSPWPSPPSPSHQPAPPPVPVADEPVKRKPSGLRNAVEWVVIIAGALLVAFVVKTFLVQAFYIPSGSMMPTLEEQDRVLVNKLSYDLHDVERGDLIVFEGPDQAPGQVKDLIKRVIALPGETVEAREGFIYIDGKLLEEPYLGAGITTGPLEPHTIPAGHYWVMGDNRGNSRDSRFFGPIEEGSIIGKAFVRVWPINHFRFFF
ncbi:MAG: signal peptidase I [Acidimicrobiia bacterium]